MPENQMEPLPFPWVTTQTALKMLKKGKFGLLGVFKASLPPHKRPKNQSEANFWNIPAGNITRDAENQMER